MAHERQRILMLCGDMLIDRRILEEGRSLARQGHDITVLASGLEEETVDDDSASYPELTIIRVNPERTARYADGETLRRIQDTIKVFPDFRWDHLLSQFLDYLVEGFRIRPHIIFAHDLPYLPFGALIASAHGAYLVYDSHELYPRQDGINLDGIINFLCIEETFLPYADLVMTVGQSMAEIMAETYQIPLPAVVRNLPGTFGRTLPIPQRRRFHERLGLSETAKVFLYQGWMNLEERNLEVLVEAGPLLDPSAAVIVFMGYGEVGLSALRRRAEELGTLNRQIFFVDKVPQSELLDYTASADVGVIPYRARSLVQTVCFPNKLGEFLAVGLPIMATPLVEIERMTRDAGTAFVQPLDTPEQVRDTIEKVLAAPLDDIRKELQANAYRYTWEEEAKHFLRILSPLINKELIPAGFLASEFHLAEQAMQRGKGAYAQERLKRIMAVVAGHPRFKATMAMPTSNLFQSSALGTITSGDRPLH